MPVAKVAYSLELASCTCIGRLALLEPPTAVAHHTQHTTGTCTIAHCPLPNMQLVRSIQRGAGYPMHMPNGAAPRKGTKLRGTWPTDALVAGVMVMPFTDVQGTEAPRANVA